MEFIENIEKNEYEDFLLNNNSHFMQTYEFGEIRKIKHFKPHYVGLKENGKLVCTAMLLEKKLKGKYIYYYVPRGYTIDYNNKELLKTFTENLYKYCKKTNAIFLKIDPGIKRYTIDLEKNKIDGEDNTELIEYLKKLGYTHHGFNLGFEGFEPRFTFRINIDKPIDEIFKSFSATTRKVLNKGNQYNLNAYIGNTKDIKHFYETMIETSKREGIVQAPINYYQSFYEIFNKKNMSDLYIIKCNIEDTKNIFLKDIKLLEEKQEANPVKVKENQARMIKLKKILDELNSIKEKEITLAAIMTVKYKDTVWTVHGGNNSKLMSLNANYLLYYNIIKDANKEGKKVVDLFGTCGIPNPDPSNPIYGIHSFKKRLGGEYIEFIGEFDLVVNKKMYFIYQKIVPIKNKIHHYLQRKKNKNID